MSQLSSQPPTIADNIRPLLVGVAVPELSLLAQDGGLIDLKAVLAEKPTVLIFYRGSW